MRLETWKRGTGQSTQIMNNARKCSKSNGIRDHYRALFDCHHQATRSCDELTAGLRHRFPLPTIMPTTQDYLNLLVALLEELEGGLEFGQVKVRIARAGPVVSTVYFPFLSRFGRAVETWFGPWAVELKTETSLLLRRRCQHNAPMAGAAKRLDRCRGEGPIEIAP